MSNYAYAYASQGIHREETKKRIMSYDIQLDQIMGTDDGQMVVRLLFSGTPVRIIGTSKYRFAVTTGLLASHFHVNQKNYNPQISISRFKEIMDSIFASYSLVNEMQ